ncbi:MAG: heparan-alpha-glucosaminide N-acetyltransferase domain-containing protein [Betaproteobacteria bacterium]|nr:heparan-alpha-glucosaminide N-acetyltransferase domain-containing protein [Betaproteobacteria bacterium]
MMFDKSEYRIAAIDWMRGIVMILMALDHASGFFNNGRIFADSILLYETGDILAADQFLTRWITHICAPTFVFLAGTAIAINTVQRQQQGISSSVIDRELFIRGAFIALLDLLVLSLAAGKIVLQVLYAIGVSMMIMVVLRRLGARVLFFAAITILIGSEFLLMVLWEHGGDAPLWLALTFAPVFSTSYSIMYPLIPWLAMMMLGWVFGERLMSKQSDVWPVQRLLMVSGCVALMLFMLIRGMDGYGNMFMLLEGDSLVQWLHISKYPPSLAYTLLELGLMAIILAALMRLEKMIRVRSNEPVLLFGQTALFFYLAHFGVLAVLSLVLSRGGLEQAYLVALLVLVILYPICRIYRSLKWQNPQSLLRFL